MQTSINFTIWH